MKRNDLWNHELSSLSPVSATNLALDARLRADMGAPDVRYVVVVSGENQEAVLKSAEKISAALEPLVIQGKLAGFESPSRYLPSLAAQTARQASLPDKAELTSRLEPAVQDLPVRPQLFEPFFDDVETARKQNLLTAADLKNTSMAMAVDALLIRQNNHWSALLPLSATADGNLDPSAVRAAIKTSPNAVFVDLKSETNKLYSGYLHEAILLSLAGLIAITGLLLFTLRSPSRVLRMILPLAAAVLTVTAGLALFGQQLIILHLIGLLLVVAIGSNYTLFFDPPVPGPIEPHTFASLLFANIATVIGFGLLAFSTVPVLQAMGMTVAPGVILALVFAAIFARQPVGHAR
jgi:predicted exporter